METSPTTRESFTGLGVMYFWTATTIQTGKCMKNELIEQGKISLVFCIIFSTIFDFYLFSTLDRIDPYGKTDEDKKKYAKGLMQSSAAQLDAIMGADKRKEYITYIQDKLKKAGLMKGV